MAELELTREELLDVALLDVISEGVALPEDAVIEETRDWCSDRASWSPEAWLLLVAPAGPEELGQRLAYLTRLGMVRRREGMVRITRAGFQMWDGFPWEFYSEDDD